MVRLMHTATMVRLKACLMSLSLAPRRFRRGIAVLMMLVISVVSFTVVMHRAALAAPAQLSATSWLSLAPMTPAKPCQKMVPPGALNTCPLANFSLAAILGADAGAAIAAPTAATAWRLSDSSLPVQVAGLGLYRPPRS